MNDPKQWAADMGALVKRYVASSISAVSKRLDVIEAKLSQIHAGPKGEPGRDGVDGADGQPGKDGQDAPAITPDMVAEALKSTPELLQYAVESWLSQNPPAPGRDGADGIDGKDAPAPSDEQVARELRAMPEVLNEAVAGWLSLNPPAAGRDGADGKDGEPVTDEQISRQVASHLALNPPPAGRDGRDGLQGLQGEKGLDGLNGSDGRDGADGLSLENLEVSLGEDGRTLLLELSDSGRVFKRELSLPIVIDRGIYRPETEYAKGDGVTFGGSFWISQQASPVDRPGDSAAWRLAVKRGRDGKDGAPGMRGDRGMPGMSSEEVQRRRAGGEQL